MPNQRSQNKVFLGGYIEKDLKRRIVNMARDAGMSHNRFGFVMELISKPLMQRIRKNRRSQGARFSRQPLRA